MTGQHLLLLTGLVAVSIARAPVANADVVLESYAGPQRPKQVERAMSAFLAEAERIGFIAARDRVAATLGDNLPREGADPTLTAGDLAKALDQALSAWKKQPPIAQLLPPLERAVDMGLGNPALIVADLSRREPFKRVMIYLALAYQRNGDTANSERIEKEMIRTYPADVITQAQYGPDAEALYKVHRAELDKAGRGTLTVRVDDPNVHVYVDEVIRPANTTIADLAPGPHRVLVIDSNNRSKRYDKEVLKNQDAILKVDWEVDSVVVAAPWIGFLFQTETEHQKEAEVARRFASGKGSSVVVIGLWKRNGVSELVGTRVGFGTGAVLVRASIPLGTKDEADRARALARAMAKGQPQSGVTILDRINGDKPSNPSTAAKTSKDIPTSKVAAVSKDATSPSTASKDPTAPKVSAASDRGSTSKNASDSAIDFDSAATPDDSEPTEAPNDQRRWMWWTGAAAIGVGLVGGGLTVKFALDAHADGEELALTCAVSCTSQQVATLKAAQSAHNRDAIISGVAGGAAVITGGVLLGLWYFGKKNAGSPTVSIGSHGSSIGWSVDL